MKLSLSIYSNGNLFQYRLPAVSNTNHTLSFPSNMPGLAGCELRLENICGDWRLLPSENYSVNAAAPLPFALKQYTSFKLTFTNGSAADVTVAEVASGLKPFALIDISKLDTLCIGKSPQNHICYDYKNLVSKHHAELVAVDGDRFLADKSKNGVFVNGERVESKRRLKRGDKIYIMGLKLVYLGDILAINDSEANVILSAELHKADPYRVKPSYMARPTVFKRAPRIVEELHSEAVEIDPPPVPQKQTKQPLLLTIGPAFTMVIPMLIGSGVAIASSLASGGNASLFMYTGIITAAVSAIIGGGWAIANVRYSSKAIKQEEKRRFIYTASILSAP